MHPSKKEIKKQLTQALIVLVISIGGALLFPNFLKENKSLELPNINEIVLWTLVIFAVFSISLYINKPKERLDKVPDGYHELYNENDQVTKKGMFASGRQINGTKRVYKKDGTFSHIENCINGVYTKDIS